MTLQIADRVKETTTTTGTGAITLAGAMTGFRAFSSMLANGDTCYYALQAVDGTGAPTGAWEVGLGTYTTSGNTLSRTLITSSTGALLSLAAGTTQVWLDRPAVTLGFRGAQATNAATTQVATTATALQWSNSLPFDTDGYYNSANPTRLTIPAGKGITKVRLTANVVAASGGTNGSTNVTWIRKNGTAAIGGQQANYGAYNNPYFNISTGPLAVADNDYFEVMYFAQTAGLVLTAGASSFAIEAT